MKRLQPTEVGHNLAQPPAMPPCPICLGDIDPETQQQHRRHPWPGCQHPVRLGCLMHFGTRQGRPTCPACRQSWTPQAGQHLDQGRAAADLEWLVPETPADTTAPRNHPPNPPTNIIPLCCPRLVLINHMRVGPHHGPNHTRMARRIECLGCNREVTTEHGQPGEENIFNGGGNVSLLPGLITLSIHPYIFAWGEEERIQR